MKIHGSDTGYCQKKTVFNYRNPVDITDSPTQVKFELGNLAEEFLNNKWNFPNLVWQYGIKSPLDKGWTLVQHPDFVDPFKHFIISVKTTAMKQGRVWDGWRVQLFREMKGYYLEYPYIPESPKGVVKVWHLNERDLSFHHYDYKDHVKEIDRVWDWTVKRANCLVKCFTEGGLPKGFEEHAWECKKKNRDGTMERCLYFETCKILRKKEKTK